MKDKSRDRELGMDRPITRRDFLNGVALTAAGAAGFSRRLRPSRLRRRLVRQSAGACRACAATAKTAMNVMHSVRDGDFWDTAPAPQATGETYDLVVVGGGISGLAAAFLYRQQVGEQAKILILENNDDFGGHARRNEFTASNGKTILGYGGSQSLQTPSYFSPLVNKVLADVGIDLDAFENWYDAAWHEERGLGEAVFFAKEVFGTDALVSTTRKRRRLGAEHAAQRQGQARPDRADRRAARLSARQDRARRNSRSCRKTTYADFLTKICGYDPQLVAYFQNSTEAYFGMRHRRHDGARRLGQLRSGLRPAWISATCPTRR